MREPPSTNLTLIKTQKKSYLKGKEQNFLEGDSYFLQKALFLCKKLCIIYITFIKKMKKIKL